MKKKSEKLDELDAMVLDKMIDIMKKSKNDATATAELSNLSVAVNYLKANATVSEKKKSTMEEDIAERRKKAKERRGES